MSTEQNDFLNQFKKQLIIYAIIGIFTVLGTAIGFYYNTKSSLNNLTEKYYQLNERQNTLHLQLNSKIDKEDVIREFNEVKVLIRDINNKLK